MPELSPIGTFKLGSRTVDRMGYGAIKLAGPGVLVPPKESGSGDQGAARGG